MMSLPGGSFATNIPCAMELNLQKHVKQTRFFVQGVEYLAATRKAGSYDHSKESNSREQKNKP